MELRRALDDRAQEIVKTVPRRGYIFTAAVATEEENGTGGGAAPVSALEESAPAVPSEDGRLVVAQRVPGRYYLPLPRTPLIGRERELLEDEADPPRGLVSWRSPLAQAILGARAGEIVDAAKPLGEIAIVAVEV